jgi:hypothetical protein
VTSLYPDLGGPAPEPAPVPARRESWVTPTDVKVAVGTIVVLVIVGALLGVLWEAISPPRPQGFVSAAGVYSWQESEAFVASDGRFAIITGLTGVVAGLLLWTRTAWRGPVAIIGLAVGGVLGALATDGVGRLLGGGHSSGPLNQIIKVLPLQVHALALLAIEALLAVFCYGTLVVFSNRDDLGRSVRRWHDLQGLGGDGDGARLL